MIMTHERCIGIQWGPGSLRPFDGPPPYGCEFEPGCGIVCASRDDLRLEVCRGETLAMLVLTRVNGGPPLYSLAVRKDEIAVDPFIVWARRD